MGLPARSIPPPEFALTNPASEAQKKFIGDLLDEREVKPDFPFHEYIEDYSADAISKPDASALITALQKTPVIFRGERTSGRSADLPEVPSGLYAVEDDDGDLKFYRVQRPKSGKWSGWTFVDVQASSDFYPVRPISKAKAVLAKIAKDPRAAGMRYGRELGKCCKCRRILTNKVSRKYGIGPICAGRTEWFSRREINDLLDAGE